MKRRGEGANEGKPRHPMQPLVIDEEGIVRFRENRIVRALLDHATQHGLGLNEIAMMDFPPEDETQLAQLIGYSVSGFHELSYVSDEDAAAAADAARRLVPCFSACRDAGCPIHTRERRGEE